MGPGTVSCERNAQGVFMTVDGVPAQNRKGWTGLIDNKAPLTIGGKRNCDGTTITCDYLAGDIDWVRISKG
jgi:hypothetical protein